MSLTFATNLTKMIDAGLGGELVAPDTSVAVGYRMQYNLVSGPVASWNDPEGGLPVNLVAAIEPIQDLHGQDAPYPAGGGKNLVDWTGPQTVTGQTTLVTYETSEQAAFTASVTGYKGSSINGRLNLYAYNGSTLVKQKIGAISSTTATRVSVTLDMTGETYDRFLIVITGEASGYSITVSDLQLEKNSTATDYAPYSNICPISGRTFVDIWHDATHDTSAEPTLTIQLGQTVYGGSLDVTNGVLTVEWANIASYDGETLPGEWISDRDVYAPGTTPTTGAQVCYKLAEPLTIQLSAQTITSLLGQNNVWSDSGDVSVTWKEKLYTEGY